MQHVIACDKRKRLRKGTCDEAIHFTNRHRCEWIASLALAMTAAGQQRQIAKLLATALEPC
jgi:hypothetical protein